MNLPADITITGLGPGAPGHITLQAWESLQSSPRTFLRTGRHPIVSWLSSKGVTFSTFDYLYEQAPDFETVYAEICRTVLEAARQGAVLYAVPGHPLVAERSVTMIIEAAKQAGLTVCLQPALSFLTALTAALRLDAVADLRVVDGLCIDRHLPLPAGPTVITQVYSRLVASDVKVSLLEYYPAEQPITVVRGAGIPEQERIRTLPLFELDRLDWVDHLTSLYLLVPENSKLGCSFPLDPLADLLARLRARDGCPWDREQDHLTLRPYLLEETYEVLEALNEENMYKLCEELGDLLLQIVFHAQIASEHRVFDLNDVVSGISEKIIRRHPHVFGSATAKNSEEVRINWEKIKAQEKGRVRPDGLLDSVSKAQPALMRAVKLQKKASTVGFDWPDHHGALEKYHEELDELKDALSQGDKSQVEKEMGDLLFSLVNLARLIGVEPEAALTATSEKFVRRFAHIETKALNAGTEIVKCTMSQLDIWWEEAKKLEKSKVLNKKHRKHFLGGRN